MKHLLLLLFLLLAGCTTVVVQPAPQASVPEQTGGGKVQGVLPTIVCPPYSPPRRKQVPLKPTITEHQGNYAKSLEEVAETMIVYVKLLRDYIDDEDNAEDNAVRDHYLTCQPL